MASGGGQQGPVLAAAGAKMEDVTKTTIFLSDFANYKGMNAVYSEYFGDNPPVRSCLGWAGTESWAWSAWPS